MLLKYLNFISACLFFTFISTTWAEVSIETLSNKGVDDQLFSSAASIKVIGHPDRLVKMPIVASGNIRMGVDTLGRFVAVLDEDLDAKADLVFIFTGNERYPETWEMDAKVHLLYTKNYIQIRTIDKEAIVHLTLKPASEGKPKFERAYKFSFIERNGGHSMGWFKLDSTIFLSEFTVYDIFTWPSNMWFDALDPGTTTLPCESAACQNPATSCSVVGCEITPTGCSISCPHALQRACCTCYKISGPPYPAWCQCCSPLDQ